MTSQQRSLRVLVTGGRGKVGSRVMDRLAAHGHTPIATDVVPARYGAAGLAPGPYVRADLTDFGQAVATLASARADAVVHAAGIPEPNHDPQHVIFANNALSMFNICEAMVQLGVPRLVYLSSETVPGFVTAEPALLPDYLPVDESHPVRPQEAYALSKYVGEILADALVRRADATAVSIRASFVVGEDEYSGLLKDLREAPPGPFANLWSYVDIDDLADLVALAVSSETPGHEVVYAAQPDNFMGQPLAELVDVVYGAAQAPEIHELARPDSSGIDSSRARSLFGWDPTRSWRQ